MRIVLDDAKPIVFPPVEIRPLYFAKDTIEITDAEWDEIWLGYEQESIGQGFSQYLRELLELKRNVK